MYKRFCRQARPALAASSHAAGGLKPLSKKCRLQGSSAAWGESGCIKQKAMLTAKERTFRHTVGDLLMIRAQSCPTVDTVRTRTV
jgi:hypothetical protein